MPIDDAELEVKLNKAMIKVSEEKYKNSVALAVQEYAQALKQLSQQGRLLLYSQRILSFWSAGIFADGDHQYALYLFPNADLKLVRNSPKGLFQQRTLEDSIEGDFDPQTTKDYFDPRTRTSVNETILKELREIYSRYST
jgi:hypothetical protein